LVGHPVWIIDKLYAGPGCVDLGNYGINADIIITLDPSCSVKGDGNQRIVLPLEDFNVEPIKNIGKAVQIIDKKLKKNNSVYVHCHAGCGRTGTIVVSYLILFKDMQLNQAIDIFYEKRHCGPDSMPQEIFLEALYKMKRKLGSNNLVLKILNKSETLDDFLQNLRE
jgi:atypical dual specificity phosphatase